MDQNPYAAPKALVEPAEEFDNQREPASRWARLFAAMLDTLVILLAIGILFGLLGLLLGEKYLELVPEQGILPDLLGGISAVALYFVINWSLLRSHGQTLGKRVLGIRIVDADGKVPGTRALLKRYAFFQGIGLIPAIGPLLSLINVLGVFGSSRQCMHDMVADTFVIRARRLG